MKFGVNTFIWTMNFDGTQVDLLPRIKEHGFDGIEVAIFNPATFDAAGIRRGIETIGLECTVCSVIPNGMAVFDADGSVREKTYTHLRDCVQAIADVGAKTFLGPLYSPVGYLPGRRRTDDEWKWCVECYQRLGPTLAEYGVTLAVEPLNRFETYFLNTAADACRLCDEVNHPNVGVTLDTFHLNIEEKSIPAAIRASARHVKHIHTCENDRGAPGSGHVEWDGVFSAIRDIGYDRWLTIESFCFSLGEISAAASIWRDLAPTPEDIAFDGVRFLKAQMAKGATSPRRV
jgi:D-psicose/D-tagatose/L-ribulose 3-epimerase